MLERVLNERLQQQDGHPGRPDQRIDRRCHRQAVTKPDPLDVEILVQESQLLFE